MKIPQNILFLLTSVLILLTACNTASTNSPTAASSQETPDKSSYSDAFEYCASVGTVDQPEAPYSGTEMPEAVAVKLRLASGAASDAPLDPFIHNAFWRCMDGKVYACFVGANLPCMEKADLDPTPSTAEIEYCKENPASEFIPAVVTGRETVLSWSCVDGVPQAGEQLFQVDSQGFIADFWYLIDPD